MLTSTLHRQPFSKILIIDICIVTLQTADIDIFGQYTHYQIADLIIIAALGMYSW